MDLVVTSLLCVAVILALVLLAVKSALSWKVPVKGETNIPGAPGVLTLPIVGNVWKFMGVTNMRDVNVIMEKMVTSGPKAGSFFIGSKLLIGIADPKLNESILNSSKSNTKDPELFEPINRIVDGVFSRNGEGWSNLRKPLNKFLQPKTVVERHFDVIATKCEELCEALSHNCGEGVFDIHPYVQRCTLETTFETLMGLPGAHAKEFEFDLHWGKKLATMWFTLLANFQFRIGWLFHLSKTKKELELLQENIRIFGKKVMNCRKRILAENYQDPEDSHFEPECYTDVTIKQALKEKHDGYTMPTDLILAGYDTSSVALSSAFLFLAMHPEYQERAYREQIEILGDTLRAPTYEELTKMEYLGMLYQETLRHVGVPAIIRQCSTEVVVDDLIFPEGSSVYVALHATHIKPEYWEKPKEFYPEHFLPENVSKRPKGAFLPFSAGARVCPGKAFALISSKIILSMLLRRFHLTTTMKFNEMDYNYLFLLESVNGYPVQLTKRTQRTTDYDVEERKRFPYFHDNSSTISL